MFMANELKKVSQDAGADLVGIAPIERFAEISKEHHPCSIFPETKSVIVLGKRIVRGAIRGIEEGTQFANYSLFARQWLSDRFMPMITITVAEFIENNRFEAVALPNLPHQMPATGVSVQPDRPAPNVFLDFNDAAVRAGLGEISYTGELFTPQYGPLQRLQIILTDAELEPDAIYKGQICDRCKECVKACPLDAIDDSKDTEIIICGKKMVVAKTDFKSCNICKNGAFPNDYHQLGLPDRLAAICHRTCLKHLEEKELLTKKFKKPFRKRAPWKKDVNGTIFPAEEI